MSSKTLTAAIQFGSSRICAVAAWIDKNGHYEVAAIESTQSTGCIHRGLVVNIAEAAGQIKSLMLKLSNRVKQQGFGGLDAAYVGICGMSMHSMEYHPSILVDEGSSINGEICQQLQDMSMNLKGLDYEIVGLHSNGELIVEQQAIGKHQLILADSKLKAGVLAAMERAHIKVMGVYATPLLVGDILTDDEKRAGCLLVDFGAQLTTVSIYRDCELKFLTVLPIGGDAVTQDIATNGMRFDEAEQMKTQWSDASRSTTQTLGETSLLTSKELNVIVASRFEEIVANIANQVEKAGYKGQLQGGCIITGGASCQKGITSLLSKKLGIGCINTRGCSNIKYGSSERKPNLTSLMSMLMYCNQSCESEAPVVVVQEPTVSPKKSPIVEAKKQKSGLGGFFSDLFSGMDEN